MALALSTVASKQSRRDCFQVPGIAEREQCCTIEGLLQTANENTQQSILMSGLLRITRQRCYVGQRTQSSLQGSLQHEERPLKMCSRTMLRWNLAILRT